MIFETVDITNKNTKNMSTINGIFENKLKFILQVQVILLKLVGVYY